MDEQCYDLISGAGLEPLLVGGRGQASGFIMRMMAENKKKHNGSYKNPTAPLHPDSTMNGAVPFDYGKLANKGQKGTNKSDYGASPFIERTFGTNKKAEEETDTQKDARAKAQSEDLLKKAEELLAASKKKSKVQEFLTGVLKKRKAKGVLKGLKEAKAKKDEEDVFTDVPELTILSKEVLDNRVFATFGAFWEEWVDANKKVIKDVGYSRERQYDILHTEAIQGHGALFGNLLSGPSGYNTYFTSLNRGGGKELYKEFLKTFLGYEEKELKEWKWNEVFKVNMNNPFSVVNRGRTDSFWWYKDMSKAGWDEYEKKVAEATNKMNIFGQSLVMRIAGLLVGDGDTIAITPNVEYQSYDEKTRKYTKKLGDRLLIISGDMANDITGIFTNNYRGVNGYSLPQDKQVFLKGDKWVFDDDKYKSDNNIARRDKGWVEMYRKAVDEYKGDVSLTDTWVELEPTDGGDRDVYRILEEFAIEEKKPKAKATKRK